MTKLFTIPEARAILDTCRSEPGEDVHLLALADWIEENGDDEDQPRAAFIRDSIDSDKWKLSARAGRILEANHRRWLEPTQFFETTRYGRRVNVVKKTGQYRTGENEIAFRSQQQLDSWREEHGYHRTTTRTYTTVISYSRGFARTASGYSFSSLKQFGVPLVIAEPLIEIKARYPFSACLIRMVNDKAVIEIIDATLRKFAEENMGLSSLVLDKKRDNAWTIMHRDGLPFLGRIITAYFHAEAKKLQEKKQ